MVLAFATVEGSANDWLSLALIDGYDVPSWVGVAGFSVFVTSMTLGRLLGPAALDRFGRAPVLWTTSAAALIGVLLVVEGGHWLPSGWGSCLGARRLARLPGRHERGRRRPGPRRRPRQRGVDDRLRGVPRRAAAARATPWDRVGTLNSPARDRRVDGARRDQRPGHPGAGVGLCHRPGSSRSGAGPISVAAARRPDTPIGLNGATPGGRQSASARIGSGTPGSPSTDEDRRALRPRLALARSTVGTAVAALHRRCCERLKPAAGHAAVVPAMRWLAGARRRWRGPDRATGGRLAEGSPWSGQVSLRTERRRALAWSVIAVPSRVAFSPTTLPGRRDGPDRASASAWAT